MKTKPPSDEKPIHYHLHIVTDRNAGGMIEARLVGVEKVIPEGISATGISEYEAVDALLAELGNCVADGSGINSDVLRFLSEGQ